MYYCEKKIWENLGVFMCEKDKVMLLIARCHTMELSIRASSTMLRCLINYGPDIDGEMMRALEELLEILDCNKIIK